MLNRLEWAVEPAGAFPGPSRAYRLDAENGRYSVVELVLLGRRLVIQWKHRA